MVCCVMTGRCFSQVCSAVGVVVCGCVAVTGGGWPATYAMSVCVGNIARMCYTLYSVAGRYSTIAVGVHCSQKRVYWQAESCPERPSWASHHATHGVAGPSHAVQHPQLPWPAFLPPR